MKGNGTNWVAPPFRVYAAETNDSSSSASQTVLRAIPIPFKYLGDKGKAEIRYSTSFSGTSAQSNLLTGYVNSSSGFAGGTKVLERGSSSGLNITALRILDSTTLTNHVTAAQVALAPETTSVSSNYTYNSANMTHFVFTAICSGLTSDTITFKNCFVDIFPSFS